MEGVDAVNTPNGTRASALLFWQSLCPVVLDCGQDFQPLLGGALGFQDVERPPKLSARVRNAEVENIRLRLRKLASLGQQGLETRLVHVVPLVQAYWRRLRISPCFGVCSAIPWTSHRRPYAENRLLLQS